MYRQEEEFGIGMYANPPDRVRKEDESSDQSSDEAEAEDAGARAEAKAGADWDSAGAGDFARVYGRKILDPVFANVFKRQHLAHFVAE